MKLGHLYFASAIAVCLCMQPAAALRLDFVEKSVESSTSEVRIPNTPDASLTLRHCPDCPVVTLRITEETRFFIDEQQVAQPEFRKAADRRSTAMTVYYLPESNDITRIVMHAGSQS